MSVSQANDYKAVFELAYGSEATLPVVVWASGSAGVFGLVNQLDIEQLLGKQINYGHTDDGHGLVSPQPYKEFRCYRRCK